MVAKNRNMKIDLPEKYADLYLKALVERKHMLESKIDDFKREIEEIDGHISKLTSFSIFNDNQVYGKVKWETSGYRPEWPWTQKIGYYLDFRGKVSTTQDVVNFLLEKEPELDKSKTRSSVSAALSNKAKNGKYTKFVDPVTQQTYYGLSEWFDEQHHPGLDHVPNDLKERLISG